MTTKLVSANMGIILVVEKDGKQETKQWSMICPSKDAPQPYDVIFYLKRFLEDELESDIDQVRVLIAKPKKIKATRSVSQDEFNKRINELGYKP